MQGSCPWVGLKKPDGQAAKQIKDRRESEESENRHAKKISIKTREPHKRQKVKGFFCFILK